MAFSVLPLSARHKKIAVQTDYSKGLAGIAPAGGYILGPFGIAVASLVFSDTGDYLGRRVFFFPAAGVCSSLAADRFYPVSDPRADFAAGVAFGFENIVAFNGHRVPRDPRFLAVAA
jgi:hypothetical protein